MTSLTAARFKELGDDPVKWADAATSEAKSLGKMWDEKHAERWFLNFSLNMNFLHEIETERRIKELRDDLLSLSNLVLLHLDKDET